MNKSLVSNDGIWYNGYSNCVFYVQETCSITDMRRFQIWGKKRENTYTIQEEEIGQVQIADEVVAIIAGLAAMEVDGVSSMAGTSTRDLISKLGKKNLSKGVKVDVLDGVVTVSLSLNLRFGKNIMEVSSRVQEKVKAAIENMTGLSVADVNIKVAGVDDDTEN